MATALIHDRGRGPEIVGTRITVYNLLPDFLDSTATEDVIARKYELTVEQVAAVRAYVLNHADTILARHLEIETRMAAGNTPEVIARARQTHADFLNFKDWLAQRRRNEERDSAEAIEHGSSPVPSFREWREEQEAQPVKAS